MFDEYVEKITNEIELVNQSVLEVKDLFEENLELQKENLELQLESTDLIETVEIIDNDQLELVDDEDDLLISLNENFDFMASNLETIVFQNEQLLESINSSDQNNVQGYWFIFIAIVVALGLRIFLENMMKW